MKPYTLFKRRGDDRDTAIWYVRVMENGRRKAYSTGRTRKDEAEDFAELHYGSGRRAPTLGRFVEERHLFERGACLWIARRTAGGHDLSENTLLSYRHALALIVKQFGEKRLSEIRLRDLEVWILSMDRASSTKSVVLGVLRILFKEAIREELLKDDPTKQLEPLKIKRLVRGVFTLAELGKLFPPGREDLNRIWGSQLVSTFFLTMATAGLRNSETRALQWRHYLRDDKALLIEQQEQLGKITRTKGKRDRLVPIPSVTCAELDAWHETTLRGEFGRLHVPQRNRGPIPNASGAGLAPSCNSEGWN